MGMFDYKHYNSKQSAEMVVSSHKLAVFTNAASFMYLPGAKILNFIGKISGNWYANKINIAPPENWRELTPAELKLPEKSKDITGYYPIKSPLTGYSTIPGMGPQVKIFGEFKDGKVTRVSFSFAGTNDPLDVADYFQLNSGEMAPHMNPLLNSLKNYVVENQLSAKDVIITGYSSGGGLVNVAAKYRETLADGFFKDANFIAHASPYIYDDARTVFNVGFENDAVFRILGNEANFKDAVKAMKPGMVNPDKPFESAPDNVVLFGNKYGSIFWNIVPLSILAKPFGSWAAHGDGVRSDAFSRITNSKFYEYTSRDSVVIVDQLNAMSRWNTWVKDKASHSSDHYGKPAFIIGNDHGNLLQGGKNDDYIDAGKGDDKIKTGTGVDRIEGGEGNDTLILSGQLPNWDTYRLKDGTFFAKYKFSADLKQADHVEQLAFEGETFTQMRPYTIEADGLHQHRYLIKGRNSTFKYAGHAEGTDHDDSITGKVVFGKDGDDTLSALKTGSLLHGGQGNDILLGSKGNDFLYGAEGNDLIYGGAGKDHMYGGVGNDVFSFNKQSSGLTQIHDFDSHKGYKDSLLFTRDLFSSVDDVRSHTKQYAGNTYIHKYNVSIIIDNNSLLDNLEQHIAIA